MIEAKNTNAARLLEERRRRNLVRNKMAAMAGLGKRPCCNYESGERECGSNSRSKLGKAGVDVQFILTEIRSTTIPTFHQPIASELDHAFKNAQAALSQTKALALNY